MRLLNLFEDDLMELRQRWKAPGIQNGETRVLAFRGDYWLLGEHDDIDDIPANVIADIANHTGLPGTRIHDAYNLMDMLSDFTSERPDLLFGYIYNNELHLDTREAGSHHPYTSGMIRKLVQDLGLRGVNIENVDWEGDEANIYVPSEEARGQVPTVLFHGTSSEYMRDIARTGIRPGLNSNWEKLGIKHNKIIFGSVDIAGALFHANKTSGWAAGDTGHADPDDPFSVILEFSIPDQTKVVPDYDVAAEMVGATTQTTQLGYTWQQHFDRTHNPAIPTQNPEGRAWKSTGIFGYAGRYPRARRHTEGGRARAGLYQQAVGVAVIPALELYYVLSLRVRAGQPYGAHGGLRAGAYEPHHLHRG